MHQDGASHGEVLASTPVYFKPFVSVDSVGCQGEPCGMMLLCAFSAVALNDGGLLGNERHGLHTHVPLSICRMAGGASFVCCCCAPLTQVLTRAVAAA
jgi:hypothetical protein